MWGLKCQLSHSGITIRLSQELTVTRCQLKHVGAPLAAALDRCGSNDDSKDRRWTEPILGVPLSYRWTRTSSGLLARVTV